MNQFEFTFFHYFYTKYCFIRCVEFNSCHLQWESTFIHCARNTWDNTLKYNHVFSQFNPESTHRTDNLWQIVNGLPEIDKMNGLELWVLSSQTIIWNTPIWFEHIMTLAQILLFVLLLRLKGVNYHSSYHIWEVKK